MNPRNGGCTLCSIIDIKISFSYGVLLKDVKRQCNDDSIITNLFLQAIITININEYSLYIRHKIPFLFLERFTIFRNVLNVPATFASIWLYYNYAARQALGNLTPWWFKPC